MNEQELLDFFKEIFPEKKGSVTRWAGEDAAFISMDKSTQVSSLDLLLEDVHFSLYFSSMEDVGTKLLLSISVIWRLAELNLSM